MRTLIAFVVTALLTLSLAACGEEAPAGAGPDLAGTSWILTGGTVDGTPLAPIATAPVTLRFGTDGTAGGTAACNSYGGDHTAGAGTIAFPSGFAVTEMACMDNGVMALESAYLAGLIRTDSYLATDTSLTLTGTGVELRFSAVPPEPDAALVGTIWELDTILSGDSASTPIAEATIRFGDDGSVGGNAGCNGWFGTYDPATGFGEIGSTLMACDEPIMAQESLFLSILGGDATVTISGSMLTIADLSGNALQFRAQPPEEDRPLAGTSWELETLIQGEAASTPVAPGSIAFTADGSVSGTTGCNNYFGDFAAATGFGPIGSTKMACDGVMEQEAFFLSVLSADATVAIEGALLTITAPSGDALQFRATG